MQVIVVASRKGRYWKDLAHCAPGRGGNRDRGDGPVAAIDADPMAGLTGWFDARKADEPLCVEPTALQSRGLKATLAGLSAAACNWSLSTPPHPLARCQRGGSRRRPCPDSRHPVAERPPGDGRERSTSSTRPGSLRCSSSITPLRTQSSRINPDDPQPARHRSGGRRRPGDHTHANRFSEFDDRWQDRRRTEGYQQIGRGDCQPLDRREGTIGKGKPPWPQNNRSRLTPYR